MSRSDVLRVPKKSMRPCLRDYHLLRGTRCQSAAPGSHPNASSPSQKSGMVHRVR